MKKQIYMILFLNLLVMSLMNFAHPVTPQMLELKNAPHTTNGILMALMQLSQVIFSPLWIKLFQNRKIKKFLIIGVVFYGFSQLILGYGPDEYTMFFGRVLAGFFSCSWIVGIMMILINILEPKERTKYLGYFMVTSYLGSIIGFSSMGNVGLISIYLPFILQAVVGVIIGVLIFFFLPNYQFKLQNNIVKKENIKNILKYLILILVFAFISSLYSTSIGYYLRNTLHVKSNIIGYLSSYTSFILIMTNLFLISKFEKVFGILNSLKVTVIIGFIGFIAYLIYDFTPLTNIILVLFGITLIHIPIAVYRPYIQKTMLNTSKQNANASVGYINSFNAAGVVIGALVSAYTYDILPELPFFLIGISLAIIIVFIQIFMKKDVKK